MTDIFVVPEPLLQVVGSVPFEPRQIQVVKYGEHVRAMLDLERRVDTAYTQRNNAAVALVRMALLLGWPAGRGLDNLTDNDWAWRHVVYIDLPNGEQVSYHMAPADVVLLEGLPEYTGEWDGKFTGTTAWAGMVPLYSWVQVEDESQGTTACHVCFQGAAACTATGCGFMETGNGAPGTPSEGVLDLSPAGEEKAGVTRTADGVTVGGFTFGPDTRFTHGVPPVTELQYEPVMPGLELSRPSWRAPMYCEPFSGLQMPVPKAPFPPGVCACPKCEQPREAGRLFCAPHRSVDSRFLGGPITNERLAYMMQRDGEQQ